MIIRRLALENFRGFESMTLDLDPALTVLIGANGAGKSSIIRALAIGLSEWTRAFTADGAVEYADDDIRWVTVDGKPEPMTPSVVHMIVGLPGEEQIESRLVRRALDEQRPTAQGQLGDRGHTSQKRLADRDASTATDLPLVALFRARVGVTSSRDAPANEIRRLRSRTLAYRDGLAGVLALGDLQTWMREWELAHTEQLHDSFDESALEALTHEVLARIEQGEVISIDDVMRERAGARRSPEVAVVAAAVVACLEAAAAFAYDVSSAEALVTLKDGRLLPLRLLSDGQQRVAEFAARLAWMAYRLNPHHGIHATERARGVVLIDEIELHLHPQWQQTVIPRLRSTFPGVQFIITTHSPQVLSTVHADHIRALHLDDGRGEALRINEQTEGVASGQVLAAAMGVDPIPDVPAWHDLKQYRALVEDGRADSEQARTLRSTLDRHFGQRHPVMLECDQLKRLMAFAQRRSGQS